LRTLNHSFNKEQDKALPESLKKKLKRYHAIDWDPGIWANSYTDDPKMLLSLRLVNRSCRDNQEKWVRAAFFKALVSQLSAPRGENKVIDAMFPYQKQLQSRLIYDGRFDPALFPLLRGPLTFVYQLTPDSTDDHISGRLRHTMRQWTWINIERIMFKGPLPHGVTYENRFNLDLKKFPVMETVRDIILIPGMLITPPNFDLFRKKKFPNLCDIYSNHEEAPGIFAGVRHLWSAHPQEKKKGICVLPLLKV
jgi:hypothetical protein